MLVVEQWAELRRLHFTEGLGVRELARRTGLHRKTIRRALERCATAAPPKYARPPAASKLDPFKPEVHRLLKDEPRLPVVRLRELLQPLGYQGGETILKEHVREVRPFFLPARTYQRTVYLPGELDPQGSVRAPMSQCSQSCRIDSDFLNPTAPQFNLNLTPAPLEAYATVGDSVSCCQREIGREHCYDG